MTQQAVLYSLDGALPKQNITDLIDKAKSLKTCDATKAEANSKKISSFLIGHGRQDNVVLFENAKHLETLLKQLTVNSEDSLSSVTTAYYDMEHSACPEEIAELAAFLKTVLPESQS